MLKPVVILFGLISVFASLGEVTAQQQLAPQQQLPIIRQITVSGNERVEPETIASYLAVRVGDPFDPVRLDASLKALQSTGLFSDVELSETGGVLLVRVVENPIINRIIFEGNKKLDNEDLAEEVRLRPRQVFTRARVRADVQRMLELYRRSGRFAAIIEPKVVQLEQNRIDLLFEIQEGPKSKVSKINFIGNKKYSDGDLRDVLATKQSRWWKFFTSNDTFDPDRQAYDQQVLRQFYLNEGYADFRVVSAVSELTPDREDFFVTFTVEEGEIYKFGELKVESEIRDVNADLFRIFLRAREGNIYNAEAIEQSIEGLTNAAGLLGYAFVDVRPQINRDREARTINITFRILDAPRVYVERINVRGNTLTLDRVIRREFRLQEGDAFNSSLVSRSEVRLRRLDFFREVEVERLQGSEPDRIVLDVSVEEQPTGELNLGAGFSSLENFIFDFSIRQRNFRGKGQDLRLGVRLSGFRQEIDLGFTENYFLGRRISAGFDLFARRIDALEFGSNFSQDSVGFSLRAGLSLNEFWQLSTRYTLRRDNTNFGTTALVNTGLSIIGFRNNLLTGNPDQDAIILGGFDTNGNGQLDAEDFDADGDGILSLEEILPILDSSTQAAIGDRIQSILGYTIGFDTRNSFIRPTRGHSFFFSQDFAGLGGDVRYIRSRVNTDNYWTPFGGWTFRLSGEAGFIEGIDQVVLATDRFFIGGPRIRGFDVSGIGPRDFTGNSNTRSSRGGTAFYLGRAELFFPLGEAALESGIRASAFIDAGSLFRGQIDDRPDCEFTQREFDDFQLAQAEDPSLSFGFNTFCIAGDSPSPRVAAGIGVSWQSPFGPFRIDLSRTLRSQLGDRTQTLQFNVGTTF